MAIDGWDGLIPDYGDASDPVVRARYGSLEGWVGILGNLGLFAGKLLMGLLIGSIAVVADAFHSLSDVATSGVVVLGFRYSKKPADERHPYGHGRVEHIATLVIAVLLAITGIELVLQSAERLQDPRDLVGGELALIVAAIVLASAVAKEAMARYSIAISRHIGSDALEADAWHHRSDAVSSVAVALSVVGTHYGLTFLDPVFGIVVAVIIVYVAVRLVRTSSSTLIGEAPEDGLVEEVRRLAEGVEGVEGVHDIAVHDYGTQKVITLHAEVDRDLSADEAHAIADALDMRLKDATSHPAIIHVDPEGSRPRGETWRRELEALLREEPGVVSYHGVQMLRREGREELTMHLIVDAGMSVEESHQLCHRLEAELGERCGECSVIVHFEPCVKDCEACRITCEGKVSD